MSDPAEAEILVEFTRRGAYMRCAVIHAATGIEASAMGPHNVDPKALEKIALGKLVRALAARDEGASA